MQGDGCNERAGDGGLGHHQSTGGCDEEECDGQEPLLGQHVSGAQVFG